jgi:hypothetical protein
MLEEPLTDEEECYGVEAGEAEEDAWEPVHGGES